MLVRSSTRIFDGTAAATSSLASTVCTAGSDAWLPRRPRGGGVGAAAADPCPTPRISEIFCCSSWASACSTRMV
ncbi:MAG: hypothetical protein R2939_18790 [Kofleriaceae bacterium]